MIKKKIKINLVEYCCDFATIATEAYAEGAKEIPDILKEDNETYVWNEKYQKIFDNYYDEYWDLMLQHGFEHEND